MEKVYSFDTPHGLRWPEPAEQQRRMVHQLKAALVNVERDHDRHIRDIWATVPAVADAQRHVDELVTELREARQAHSRARSAIGYAKSHPQRSRLTVEQAELEAKQADEQVTEIRRRLRAAQEQVREEKTAGYGQVRDQMRTAGKLRDTARSQTRKTAVEAGLYWATATDVLNAHITAARKVDADRAAGRWAQMRPHHDDGTGACTVQLQRAHGDNCRCGGCAARLAKEWRISEADDGTVTVVQRHRGHDLATWTLPDVSEVPELVAEHTWLPIEAVTVGRRKPRRKSEAGPPYVAVDPAMLPANPGQPADPPRTPALFADGGGKWGNVFQMWPWMDPDEHAALPRGQRRRLAKTGRMRMKISADTAPQGPTWVDLPVHVHRMIPPDAEIVQVRLVREITADVARTTVQVTVQIPDPPPVTGHGPVVAVHAGWRVRDDRELRAGVWASTGPVDIPAHLTHVVTHGDDTRTWGEIRVPARWRTYHRHTAGVQSVRDAAMEQVKRKLGDWLGEHGPVPQPWPDRQGEHPELTPAMVGRKRRPGWFARLAAAWADQPPEHGQEIAELLAGWQAQDRHLWRWTGHGARKTETRRRDHWRKVAAWLAGVASTIVVDDADHTKIRRVSPAGDEPADVQADRAAANRVVAAPAELRKCLNEAAAGTGVALARLPATGTTLTHYQCGGVNERDDRYADQVTVWCTQCPPEATSRSYDQDRNAALMLLAASGAVPPPSSSSTRSQ